MTRGGRDGIGGGKGRRQGKAYEEKDGKNGRTRMRKRKSAWTRESGSRITRREIVEEMRGRNG